MSVAEAAFELGVSRKTYYKWEAKAFDSMIKALTEREPGRPALSSEAKEVQLLREQLKDKDEKIVQSEKRIDLIKEACRLKIKMFEGLAEKK